MEFIIFLGLVLGAFIAVPVLIVFGTKTITEREGRERKGFAAPILSSSYRATGVVVCYVLAVIGLFLVFSITPHIFPYLVPSVLVLLLPKAAMLICHLVMAWSWVFEKKIGRAWPIAFLFLAFVSFGFLPFQPQNTSSLGFAQTVTVFVTRFAFQVAIVLPWFVLGLFLVQFHLRSAVSNEEDAANG